MADIAERMEADANYVSQSPGDRSTDTPTDIASVPVHRSIRLAPIVAQSSKDDQCSGRLMLLLLSRAKATDTPTDTTLDLALIDRLDGRCERTEKPKIPRTSSRVGRPDRPGAGIAAGAFAAGPHRLVDRSIQRPIHLRRCQLANEHEARARTWGFTPRGGERPDNRRSVVAQLQVDRQPIHRPIQPSGRRPGHMAIASLSRRLMYQRAFDEIADHGVILTIMTIDRVALSRVVAIANGKGGVGKTSLATTLAGLAAKAGYEILLIDLDPQGNVGEDLGYTGAGLGDDGMGLVTALTSGKGLQVSLPKVRPGVDVICGGEHLDDLAGVLLGRHRRGVPVADTLAAPLADYLAQHDYDLVIIDCPPGEPNLQLLALGAARWLIIPTQADAASLKGMSRIAQRLVDARTYNPEVELLGVVLFGVASSATRVKREISAEINQALGGVAPLFESTIRHSIAGIKSRRQGLLVHEHAAELEGEPFWRALREGRRPSNPGSAPALAGDYAALAHEILTRINTLEVAAAPAGAPA